MNPKATCGYCKGGWEDVEMTLKLGINQTYNASGHSRLWTEKKKACVV